MSQMKANEGTTWQSLRNTIRNKLTDKVKVKKLVPNVFFFSHFESSEC
jgi:hypothetical protein